MSEPIQSEQEQVYQTAALDDQSFWKKIKSVVAKAGRELIKLVLTLYYCMRDDDTPAWAKTVIIGALIYFASPIDTIPDFLPGGYVDDLAVIGAAAAAVAAHIKPEHRDRAQAWIDNAFGSQEAETTGVTQDPPSETAETGEDGA